MRRAARGGVVHLPVKLEHQGAFGVRLRCRRWRGRQGRRGRQAVEKREVAIAGLEPREVLAAHRQRHGVDDDQRAAEVARVGDDVRRAAAAAGRFAVPERQQKIAVVDRFHPAVEVGVVAVRAFADHPRVLRFGEQGLDPPPDVGGKIGAELRRRQGQHRLPTDPKLEGGAGEQHVGALGDRGKGEPFDAALRPQLVEHLVQDAFGGHGIGETPVTGESDNVKHRQLDWGGHANRA